MGSSRTTEARLRPIGVARTPFREKKDAPRQPEGARGTIELEPTAEMRDAVADLDRWTHLWIVWVFHERGAWRPKVRPPRSAAARGVLATRSPHRPNPIGLTAVRLERVEGTTLHVVGVDMLDGSPVLDVKPYVPYADAIPAAGDGWLREDPAPPWRVTWSDAAREELAWLAARGVELADPIARALALGPEPHAYRRIKKDGAAWRIAVKDWRARFEVAGTREVRVLAIASGFRRGEGSAVHRDFRERFGPG